MKQLPRACCIGILTVFATACSSVSRIDNQFRQLELGSDTYIARAGDSMRSIAFRYGLSHSQLSALNPGMSDFMAVGTRVNVRAPAPAAAIVNADNSVSRVRDPRTPEPRPAVREDRRTAAVTTTPLARHRAPRQEVVAPEEDYSLHTPAVNAVISEMALPAPSSRLPHEVQQASDEPLLRVQPSQPGTSRREALAMANTAPTETVVEVYSHDQAALSQQAMDRELGRYEGRWTWPTQGKLARGFAPNTKGRHGVDIAGSPGQPVVAVLDGTVAYSGRDPSGAGNLIIVRHADNLLTAYSHTRNLYVSEDDTVRAGDPIATLGANAQQESVLRFEVRQNGNPLNPMDFLSPR